MRRAVTIGYHHDGGEPSVITGPHVPLPQQREDMRKVKTETEHPTFQRIELWTSDGGMISKKQFAKASPKKAGESPKPKDSTPEAVVDKKPAPAKPAAKPDSKKS